MSERKSRYILKKHEIKAFKQGDLTIFKKLFYEFQPRLYRFFWFKLRSIELAEDLVQETFLRLWKARNHLKNGTPLHLYIFRIAINLATDAFRKQKVHNRTFTSLEQVLPVAQNLWPNSEYDQLAIAGATLILLLVLLPLLKWLN